jgi:hypothetical protein
MSVSFKVRDFKVEKWSGEIRDGFFWGDALRLVLTTQGLAHKNHGKTCCGL